MHARSVSEMPIAQDELATSDRQERRQALREFQRQLVERTQLARSNSHSEQMRLAVQAGDQPYLLEVAHTAEVITYEGVKPVPHTCAWFLGLINCRGRLTGVIDLRVFGSSRQTSAGFRSFIGFVRHAAGALRIARLARGGAGQSLRFHLAVQTRRRIFLGELVSCGSRVARLAIAGFTPADGRSRIS